MFLRWRVLLCTLALISLINKSFCGTNHTYPKSGGLSGNDNHSYPSSGGLSGDNREYSSTGGNHGHPSPAGSHGYSPSGGSHTYPTTTGYFTSGGSNGYPSAGSRYNTSGGSHGNPLSVGKYNSSGESYGHSSSDGKNGNTKSGTNNGYPSSVGSHGNSAVRVTSGKSHNQTAKKTVRITHITNVYDHYYYTPPKMIKYIPAGGGPPVIYPVNQNPPPKYVFHILDSGSKYGTLLAGLALMNLGMLTNTTYGHSHNGFNYKTQPGEVCLFGIQKKNGDSEETKIDCQLMSTFIIHQEILASKARNTSVTTTTTVISTTTPALGNPIYEMLPNGTLVPLNTTSANPAANTMTSSVTITNTTTNTTVMNALDVKGEPIEISPGIKCYVIRTTTTPKSRMKKFFPCKLLQTYADRSIQKNSAIRNDPAFTVLIVVFSLYFFIY